MLLNQPIARVGYLKHGGIFIPSAGFYNQMAHSPSAFPECIECKLLPACAGGCIAKAYIANGRKDGILNEKYCMFTEEQLLAYLKNYVECHT
jgi:radical SAM protein with 4Fe4S-binding SPASM domain